MPWRVIDLCAFFPSSSSGEFHWGDWSWMWIHMKVEKCFEEFELSFEVCEWMWIGRQTWQSKPNRFVTSRLTKYFGPKIPFWERRISRNKAKNAVFDLAVCFMIANFVLCQLENLECMVKHVKIISDFDTELLSKINHRNRSVCFLQSIYSVLWKFTQNFIGYYWREILHTEVRSTKTTVQFDLFPLFPSCCCCWDCALLYHTFFNNILNITYK